MRYFNPAVILAFGTALVSVEAAPLRLLVVTNNQELADNIRFGHAVPNANVNPSLLPERIVAGPDAHRLRPCLMRKIHNKAIEISNAFRTALGLPPVHLSHIKGHSNPTFSILPFIGTPPSFVEAKGQINGGVVGFTPGGDLVRIVGPQGPPHMHHDHHGHHGHHGHHKHHKHHKHHATMFCRKSPFVKRLSFALMALGPWEGRAVAFVLGCGLGVLLRMMWVLSLIAFRAVRGRRTEQTEYHIIHEYVEGEELPAPPVYAYADEKADAKKAAEETRAA